MNGQSGTASKGPTCMLVFFRFGDWMCILGLFCGVRVQFQRELTLDVQGLEQVGQSAKYLAGATRPRCGGHRFILGPFQWRQHQLGSISRSYIHGDLENSWMTCTEDWKPLSLEITFPKVPAKVLGWSTRSRCQGLFMKVMKVSWKSFQSKYFWRTYWVLMVLFRFVWFF